MQGWVTCGDSQHFLSGFCFVMGFDQLISFLCFLLWFVLNRPSHDGQPQMHMLPLPVSRIEVKPQISISFSPTKINHVVFIHGPCSTLYTYGSTNRASVKTNKKMVYHGLDIHMPQFPPRHSHSLSSHYTKRRVLPARFPALTFPPVVTNRDAHSSEWDPLLTLCFR